MDVALAVLVLDTYNGVMHVPSVAIPFLVISLLLSLLTPIGFLIYFRRKYKISYKTVLIGIAIWVVFTQILEKLVHVVVISGTPILQHPILFSFYGAVVAGIFEESGRYLAFTRFLKDKQKWEDGVAYGIGHGGIESFLLGVLGSIQTLVLFILIQNGDFNQLKAQLSPVIVTNLKAALVLPSYTYLLIGVERIFAFFLQLLLSLVVLYAIRSKKWTIFVLAIVLHVIFDFTPALYQAKLVPLVPTEIIIGIFGILSFAAVFKMQKLFENTKTKTR